ncbi:MAG: hypothetical protein HC797_08105 [Anaerolineales bacterium]|nr:hypothetical protein [Anaerolineales bacterium]
MSNFTKVYRTPPPTRPPITNYNYQLLLKASTQMLKATDLLHLPYTSDLTEGGIEYALRSLNHSYEREGRSPYERLRRLVANTAVELAFRRYLSQQNIPFEVKASTPFTDKERFDVFLGKKRCHIKSFLISHRNQIVGIRQNPAILLNTPALVPSDHHAADGHTHNDIYIFAFLNGLIAASQADLQKAIQAKQPNYLVHVLPDQWRKPNHWNPLGTLMMKSESEEELIVEVNGQDERREMKRVVINLPPKTKVRCDESFYSLTSLHVRRIPEARVGIKCESIKETYLISPLQWSNIWVYGMEIFFAGYISYDEFSQQAKTMLPNSKVFQYERTRVKNLSVPISSLKPLERLLSASRQMG